MAASQDNMQQESADPTPTRMSPAGRSSAVRDANPPNVPPRMGPRSVVSVIAHAAGRSLLNNSILRIVVILAALVLVFGLIDFQHFITMTNLTNIGTNAAVLIVLGVGMTYVMIAGGIDISVGAVLVFSGVASLKAMEAVGGDGPATIAVGLGAALVAGAFWGIFNGLMITKARIPPLIATLGTLGMAQGLAYVATNGVDLAGVPSSLIETIGVGRALGTIPWLIVVTIVVALIGGLVLHLTRFGVHTYAVGSSGESLRRSGVNVDLHLIKVYAICGLTAGIAGWMSLAKFATTTIDGHSLDNLSVISGVVIGGASLFGGAGFMFGSVIGILIPVVLEMGLIIVRVEPFWQNVAVGAILLIAVSLDQLRRRVTPR